MACHVHELPPQPLLEVVSDPENRNPFASRYAAWLLIQEGHFLDRLPPYWRAVAAAEHQAREEQLLEEVEVAFEATASQERLSLPADYVLPIHTGLEPSRDRLSVREEDSSIHFIREESTLGGLDEGIGPERMAELLNVDLRIEKRNRLAEEGSESLRQRQEEHKTAWSYEQFPQKLVDGLCEARFESWVEALLRDPAKAWFRWIGLIIPLFRRALRDGHPAANRLWDLVNPFPHQRGPGGIRYEDRGIDWILHELSRPQVDDILAHQFLRALVLDARTDRQLFDIALGARCQDQTRLAAVAGELLASKRAEDRARSTRLIGWLEETDGQLRGLAQTDSSLWVRRIAGESLDRRQRERFARHWLDEFLRQDLARERRWGAGQLFLEVADGSFEAWAFRFVREAAPDARTRGEAVLLLEAARETVKRSRPQSLEKRFLGYSVSDLENGCHPWFRRRSWHELERQF